MNTKTRLTAATIAAALIAPAAQAVPAPAPATVSVSASGNLSAEKRTADAGKRTQFQGPELTPNQPATLTLTDANGKVFTAEVTVDANRYIFYTLPEIAASGDAHVAISQGERTAVATFTITRGVTNQAVAGGEPVILMEKVENPTPQHTGTVTRGNQAIGKVAVDQETGDIAVTIDKGAPTGAGTVSIKDGQGRKATGDIGIDVTEAVKHVLPGEPPVVVLGGDFAGFVGKPITPIKLEVAAGFEGAKLSIEGSLPDGLGLSLIDATTISITGTPTKAGRTSFNVVSASKDGEPNVQPVEFRVGTADLYNAAAPDREQPETGSSDGKAIGIVVGVLAVLALALGGAAFVLQDQLRAFLP